MDHLDAERKVSDLVELKFPPEYFETHNQIPFGRDLVLLILKEGIQIAVNTPQIDVIALPPKNYQPPGKYCNHREVGRKILSHIANMNFQFSAVLDSQGCRKTQTAIVMLLLRAVFLCFSIPNLKFCFMTTTHRRTLIVVENPNFVILMTYIIIPLYLFKLVKCVKFMDGD